MRNAPLSEQTGSMIVIIHPPIKNSSGIMVELADFG